MKPHDRVIQVNREQTKSEIDAFTEQRYGQFLRWLPGGCTVVLDAGCNTGRGGSVLKSARPGLSLIGIDCVPERITSLAPGIYSEARCAMLHDTGLPDRSVDAIVAGEVIEHIPPHQVDDVLSECFRILRLKGRLILSTPNPGSLRFWWYGWSVLLEESHLSQHPPALLKQRLKMLGFRRIRLRGSGRSSAILGTRWPLCAYGSYLATAEKW